MLKQTCSFCSISLAVAAVWLAPKPAAALLEECGRIDLNTDARCEVQVEGGCDVVCDPSSLTLACSGELYLDCRDSRCDVEVDVGCSGSCTADCQAECEVDPGDFSCEGTCEAGCQADCDAKCQASGNSGECRASCEATCHGECSASCEGTPPSATCEGKCEASCEGQCKAEANVDCQIDCQGEAYVDCKANLEPICDAQCRRPEGVVMCDGQFVDAADVNACVAAIEAAIDIEVEGSASSECSGNECSAEAEGSVSCAVVPGEDPSRAPWNLAALGALFTVSVWRRGRRKER